MKKKSIKLAFNKLTISKLDNLKGIKGGTIILPIGYLPLQLPVGMMLFTEDCGSSYNINCNTEQNTDIEARSSSNNTPC